MARTLKPETAIRKQMQSFIEEYGHDVEIKTAKEDGTKVFITPPNRFGPGYIRIITPNQENWAADFGEKSLHPKRHKHLENFFSK